jgi:hypothetical protein
MRNALAPVLVRRWRLPEKGRRLSHLELFPSPPVLRVLRCHPETEPLRRRRRRRAQAKDLGFADHLVLLLGDERAG